MPLVPGPMQSPSSGLRLALFASWGAEGAHLDRYIEYLKTRTYMVDIWQRAHYTAAHRDRLAAHGATLLDMNRATAEAVASGESLGLNASWQPLPYARQGSGR